MAGAVEAVLTQQIREPSRNSARADIPRPGSKTRYRDWCKINMRKSYPLGAAGANTQTPSEAFSAASFPSLIERPAGRVLQDILIAGCGTGQRSIAMARRFGAPHMLAVAISLASLGYARRKSEELGLTIAYAQADILELERDLDTGGRQFDLIESLGVLHHLADPWAGWRAPRTLLRPGGFMLLGLYSEMARRPVLAARARIAERAADDPQLSPGTDPER
jgi:2-polyprenyl-3-methyl-5-hydroxy-6-metoxy-1,4-benzoquinol methylase